MKAPFQSSGVCSGFRCRTRQPEAPNQISNKVAKQWFRLKSTMNFPHFWLGCWDVPRSPSFGVYASQHIHFGIMLVASALWGGGGSFEVSKRAKIRIDTIKYHT